MFAVMWEIMEEDMAGLEYNAQRVIEEVEKTVVGKKDVLTKL